jgi:hypothetical protein
VAIAVERTLEAMALVYRESVSGGSKSARFRGYVDAAAAGASIQGYNPMTSKPVIETIEALINAQAEDQLEAVANRIAFLLGYDQDDAMHFTVATPGMWTDRLATEIEHRLLAKDPGGLLWWWDQPLYSKTLESEIVAQTVRLILQRGGGTPRLENSTDRSGDEVAPMISTAGAPDPACRSEKSTTRSGDEVGPTAFNAGAPATLADAARQEGFAGDMAGQVGRFHSVAAEVLQVLGEDNSLATMVAFLYGDAAAAEMGFTALGLEGRTGCEHAIAVSRSSRR